MSVFILALLEMGVPHLYLVSIETVQHDVNSPYSSDLSIESGSEISHDSFSQ